MHAEADQARECTPTVGSGYGNDDGSAATAPPSAPPAPKLPALSHPRIKSPLPSGPGMPSTAGRRMESLPRRKPSRASVKSEGNSEDSEVKSEESVRPPREPPRIAHSRQGGAKRRRAPCRSACRSEAEAVVRPCSPPRQPERGPPSLGHWLERVEGDGSDASSLPWFYTWRPDEAAKAWNPRLCSAHGERSPWAPRVCSSGEGSAPEASPEGGRTTLPPCPPAPPPRPPAAHGDNATRTTRRDVPATGRTLAQLSLPPCMPRGPRSFSGHPFHLNWKAPADRILQHRGLARSSSEGATTGPGLQPWAGQRLASISSTLSELSV